MRLASQKLPRNFFLQILITATIILSDQLSKYFISRLLLPQESIPILEKVFHLTLVHNTGIAFGLFRNHQTIVLITSSILAIFFLSLNIFYPKKFGNSDRVYLIGLTLILGGALSNLMDRIRLGCVIDFIDLRVWPVFNIADSAITIGVILIFLRCIPSFLK